MTKLVIGVIFIGLKIMLNELKNADKAIGFKQSLKAVKSGGAKKAFVAKDADADVVTPFLDACREAKVEIVYAETLEELGQACGIDVGCAVAVILI